MAHNLNEVNGEHSVFVVGEPAWHKMGQRVDEAVTSEEAIKLARLDYNVALKPVYLEDGTEVPGKFAPVRTDINVPLGIVGGRYRVLQNYKAFSFFDEVVGSGAAMYHTAGALGNGEKIWMLAKLPTDLLIKNEEKVEQYLILVNTHDGSSPIKMYYTPVRVVCQNTLSISLRGSKQGFSIRHTSSMQGQIREARKALGLSLDFSKEFNEIANCFAEKSMNTAEVDAYFDMVLGINNVPDGEIKTRTANQHERLVELFESGKGNNNYKIRHTLWAAYNAVTEYCDYEKSVKGEKENATKRISSMWFGSGADMKENAFSIGKQLITV